LTLTVEQNATYCRIRLEGDFSVTAAAELKEKLLAALASDQDLQVDLECATDIDISCLQLLWAAARERPHARAGCVTGLSPSAARLAQEAGFADFPGHSPDGAAREDSWPRQS
jgi:anti-anti-sigma regulatory factor